MKPSSFVFCMSFCNFKELDWPSPKIDKAGYSECIGVIAILLEWMLFIKGVFWN